VQNCGKLWATTVTPVKFSLFAINELCALALNQGLQLRQHRQRHVGRESFDIRRASDLIPRLSFENSPRSFLSDTFSFLVEGSSLVEEKGHRIFEERTETKMFLTTKFVTPFVT